MRKAWIAGAIVTVSGLAIAIVFYLKHWKSVDKTVAQPYVEKDLTVDEIKAKLKSDDFKQRVEAGKQIDKLEPEEKLRVLLKLSEAAETPARLLAVKKLLKIDDPRAKERLVRVAKEDPDEDIRDLAASKR